MRAGAAFAAFVLLAGLALAAAQLDAVGAEPEKKSHYKKHHKHHEPKHSDADDEHESYVPYKPEPATGCKAGTNTYGVNEAKNITTADIGKVVSVISLCPPEANHAATFQTGGRCNLRCDVVADYDKAHLTSVDWGDGYKVSDNASTECRVVATPGYTGSCRLGVSAFCCEPVVPDTVPEAPKP